MLDERTLYLVPPCDSEADGELSVLGVKQARSLGDALGDINLWAAYASPGLATEQTAEAIAQRHGLVIRRRPALEFEPAAPFEAEAARVMTTFQSIARVGPGRLTLLVASAPALAIMISLCRGAEPLEDGLVPLEPASISEVLVEETRYVVKRVGDRSHLGHLTNLLRGGN